MMDEQFAVNYILPGVHQRNFGMEKVLSKELTRNFPKVYNDMMKELCDGIDEILGVDTNSWKTLNVYLTVNKIMSKANRRVILGEALCKDEVIVYHTQRYIRWFGVMLVFLGQILPQPLRPVFGMILALPLKYHRWCLIRRLCPVFKDRLELLRKADTIADELPQDMITWTSKVALESNMVEAQDPEIVALHFIESVSSTCPFLTMANMIRFSQLLRLE